MSAKNAPDVIDDEVYSDLDFQDEEKRESLARRHANSESINHFFQRKANDELRKNSKRRMSF